MEAGVTFCLRIIFAITTKQYAESTEMKECHYGAISLYDILLFGLW